MTTTSAEGYLVGSPWDGPRTAVVFISWLFGGLLGATAAAALGFDIGGSAAGLAVAILFQSGTALAAVVAYSRSAGTGSLVTDVGLVVKPREWWGILLGFALQWAVGLILLPFVELLEIESEPQAITDLASDTIDGPGRLLLFLSFVVMAPLAEEVLFRGVLLGWLRKRLNRHAAAWISGIAFGLVHFEGPDVLLPIMGLIIIGVVLGYVALWRGNLSLVILMHAGINLLAFLVLVFEDDILERIDELESGINAVIGLIL